MFLHIELISTAHWHRQHSNWTGMHRNPVAIDTRKKVASVPIDTISNNWLPVDYVTSICTFKNTKPSEPGSC